MSSCSPSLGRGSGLCGRGCEGDVDPDWHVVARASPSFTVEHAAFSYHSSIPQLAPGNEIIYSIATCSPLPPSRVVCVPPLVPVHFAPDIDAAEALLAVFAL